jgi:uncharacterized protein YyaL (SSP411 family)
MRIHLKRGPGRLAAGSALLSLVALALTVAPAPRAEGPAAGEGVAESELPELPRPRPLDLSLPVQEAFRDWPPSELLERAYWLPWTLGSFHRASMFGRPVLYTLAVPWSRAAQRMMGETLSDPRVQTLINERFIPVLTNPDRRPDLRERYQTGTLPVVVFLLPNGNPIISKANETRTNRPITTGHIDVDPMLFMLVEADKYYDKWRITLTEVGKAWVQREGARNPMTPGDVSYASSDVVARWLLANADRQDGGFGLAPKFVLPGLYEYAALRRDRLVPALEKHARLTLRRLVASPLYDKERGGSHRMAVQPQWGDVQYEKLLEPNAWLLRELTLLVRAGGADELRAAITGTARFLTDTLGRDGGGFFNAQIADPRSEDGGGFWRGEHDRAPPADRLVLAGSNALAGAALLQAAALLDDDALRSAGRGALDLVLGRAWARGRGVGHVIEPNPGDRVFLWPQADVALALLDAYQVSGEPRYLDAAADITDFAMNNLSVGNTPLLIDHLPGRVQIGLLENPRFPVRPNVRLARAMLRLHHLGRGEVYFDRALSILGSIAGDLAEYQVHGVEAALAIEEAATPPLEITIVGRADAGGTAALRRAASNLPQVWTVTTHEAGDRAMVRVRWRGEVVEVSDPAALAAAVAELIGLPGAS